MFHKLSILIPVFNEKENIAKILEKIESVELPYDIEREIIIVDDCSTDGTREILKKYTWKYMVEFHQKNGGKWMAIRTALAKATWEYCIIQDADLEYDPRDYISLIHYLVDNNLDILYWSRDMNFHDGYSHLSFFLGWKIVTFITNILYGLSLTDEPTCYKLVKTDLLQKMNLECERFEFCPEVTAKAARMGYKIPEIGIHYYPRTLSEGKKIRWYDWVEAITTLFRYLFWKPSK